MNLNYYIVKSFNYLHSQIKLMFSPLKSSCPTLVSLLTSFFVYTSDAWSSTIFIYSSKPYRRIKSYLIEMNNNK